MLKIDDAIFNNFRSLADGTIRITIDLNEISLDQSAQLIDMFNKRSISLGIGDNTLENKGNDKVCLDIARMLSILPEDKLTHMVSKIYENMNDLLQTLKNE